MFNYIGRSTTTWKELELILKMRKDVVNSNKFLSLDQSIHLTMARFNSVQWNGESDIKHLIQMLELSWISDGYKSSSEESKFKIRAYKMLLGYFYNPLDVGKENIIINKVLKCKFSKRKMLFSKIDKIYRREDGNIEIIDYKSGLLVKHLDSFEINLSAAILIILVYHNLEVWPKFISYYYLSYNKKYTREITKTDIKQLYHILNNKYIENNRNKVCN
jgi:hypothetical protein